MQDKERETLKANAEELASLLTENIPFLINHYLTNGVLNEAEREDIIQADSAQEIKRKLVWTLAAKEDVTLDAVLEGLNATENHCVAKEITNLLSSRKSSGSADGAGDKEEDVSLYATSLVDDVISTAEQRVSISEGEDAEKSSLDGEMIVRDTETSNEVVNEIESEGQIYNAVETDAQVHVETYADTSSAVVEDVQDGSGEYEESTEDVSLPESGSIEHTELGALVSSPSSGEFLQIESDGEDMDNIDIEKEFDMVEQADETTLNNNKDSSNDEESANKQIEIENEEKLFHEDNNNELAAALARKALVRQQVEMFEKNCPGGGKVKYTLRTAGDGKVEKEANDTNSSNVKNLKNFFQRLSSSDKEATPQTAPAKSVGKLKVTFPAS